jgi:hypothetical protein
MTAAIPGGRPLVCSLGVQELECCAGALLHIPVPVDRCGSVGSGEEVPGSFDIARTTGTSTVAQPDIRCLRHRIRSEVEPGVSQTSLVAILHAPKTVHTTSQAAITATAMAVDSGTKYDESRSPAGPFTIP